MITFAHTQIRPARAFTFVEAIFTIAVIGIMSSLALSAISNSARDASRIVSRQQQAAVNEALTSWVTSQTRVGNTAQMRSLKSLRTEYNSLATTSARFNLLVPNLSSSDVNVRNGYIDQSTADHFMEYSSGTDRLHTKALKNGKQYLTMPTWVDGAFPTVELVTE